VQHTAMVLPSAESRYSTLVQGLPAQRYIFRLHRSTTYGSWL